MNNLKEIRIKNNVTQEEIAEHIGINKSIISRYERGIKDISLSLAIDIADYFKCTLDELVNRKER